MSPPSAVDCDGLDPRRTAATIPRNPLRKLAMPNHFHVVTGGPGAGKTTVLGLLAGEIALVRDKDRDTWMRAGKHLRFVAGQLGRCQDVASITDHDNSGTRSTAAVSTAQNCRALPRLDQE